MKVDDDIVYHAIRGTKEPMSATDVAWVLAKDGTQANAIRPAVVRCLDRLFADNRLVQISYNLNHGTYYLPRIRAAQC